MSKSVRYENVLSLLEEITIHNNEKVSLGIKSKWGWNEFTYKGLGLLSRRLGAYLINDLKVQRGDRLAILSESKPEYGACVFGSVLAGLTTVPVDCKLTIFEMNSILSDCEPTVLLCSATYADKAKELKNRIPSIKSIILMDASVHESSDIPSLYSLPENYQAKWVRRPLSATAFIIYTSGTTGAPKGVEITFKNMLSQMHDLRIALKQILGSDEDMRMLSILPMNHLFELTVGFFIFLHHGYSIYYPQSLKPKDIMEVMTEKKVRFMITVPAFLKLLKLSIESEISKKSALVKFIFGLNLKFAKLLPLKMRKYLFKPIHNKFGGEFFGCIAGGAPLDSAVGEFFESIGIRVYQGYGLSETSPVVAVNRGKYIDNKSVGPVLDSYEAKIDETTGELLLKGPSVMKGYYKREDLTSEVLDADGWLHTGDIARINKHGLIYITGRIKNMIVLSGGKKVFPEEVETVLEQSKNFAEVCVCGMARSFGEKDGCEEIVAIIVPTEDYASKFDDFTQLEAIVKEEVKHLSTQLAHYKRPINIVVRVESLPRTTTRKLKRQEIKKLLCECAK
ncbi:MAG: AMP-binding protein [Muribaculaceae bacterium]|nr:AMP-binding protein [Muribaculaceae bacterium]